MLISSLKLPNLQLILLCASANQAKAAYNDRLGYTVENFGPAEADLEGNMTCLGDKYTIDLPAVDGFNSNEVTMQQIVCKTPVPRWTPRSAFWGLVQAANARPDVDKICCV